MALEVRCDANAGVLRVEIDLCCDQPWTVLFGASGSGKTSVLRLIAGLWRPAGNRVVLNGDDLSGRPPHRRPVVLVAQQTALFPHLSVRENVAFGARNKGPVDEAIEQFDLASLLHRPAARLSGGEAQRVCLARALAAAPRLLLLDESFTGLHRTLRDDLVRLLRERQTRSGMRIVSVTHDVAEAFACADRVHRMDAGRIVAAGLAAQVLAAERADLMERLSGLPSRTDGADERA